MKNFATKLPPRLAGRVQKTAEERKQTVSSFLRTAAENEVNGRPRATLRERFGHCIGAAKSLPSNASTKEGYAD